MAKPTEPAAELQGAYFLRSVAEFAQLPPDTGREVALAGRSNAGKSSGLNTLTNQKALARISKTPGRTQMINYFVTGEEKFLVDLPGYGYAKVPEAMRRHWQNLLKRYLESRAALQGLLLFMDVRHPLTVLDRQLLDWCHTRNLASHCLLTKADKLKRGPAMASLKTVTSELSEVYPQASAQLFSARTRIGVDQAQERIHTWLHPAKEDCCPG